MKSSINENVNSKSVNSPADGLSTQNYISSCVKQACKVDLDNEVGLVARDACAGSRAFALLVLILAFRV